MPYDVTLAQINVAVFGFGRGGDFMGFPTSANFSTIVYSQWMCGPVPVPTGSGFCGIGPAFVPFFGFNDGTITLSNKFGTFFNGSYPRPAVGVRAHLLLSVNTQTRLIQLYINDQPVVVTGTWTGTLGSNWFTFNGDNSNDFSWDVANVASSGQQPGIGDIWCANTPSFVDLSLAANRRRFINEDLSPVDLGADGSDAFGYHPQIYCSVRPGGVATDILTNHGTGGGSFTFSGATPPSLQAPGSCTLPPPPPVHLALDNVLAFAPVETTGNLIFLSWSDDRGHSYGNPVGEPIGAEGDYLRSIQWQRLGYARDRVFRLTWSVPVATALQGAFIDATPAKS